MDLETTEGGKVSLRLPGALGMSDMSVLIVHDDEEPTAAEMAAHRVVLKSTINAFGKLTMSVIKDNVGVVITQETS